MPTSETKKKYNKEYCQRAEVKAKKAEYIRNKYKYDPKWKKSQKKKVREYYEDNKEYLIAKQQERAIEKSDEIKKYLKEYYEKNKERLNKKSREYYHMNKTT